MAELCFLRELLLPAGVSSRKTDSSSLSQKKWKLIDLDGAAFIGQSRTGDEHGLIKHSGDA